MVDLVGIAPGVFIETGSVGGLVTPNDTKLKSGVSASY